MTGPQMHAGLELLREKCPDDGIVEQLGGASNVLSLDVDLDAMLTTCLTSAELDTIGV